MIAGFAIIAWILGIAAYFVLGGPPPSVDGLSRAVMDIAKFTWFGLLVLIAVMVWLKSRAAASKAYFLPCWGFVVGFVCAVIGAAVSTGALSAIAAGRDDLKTIASQAAAFILPLSIVYGVAGVTLGGLLHLQARRPG